MILEYGGKNCWCFKEWLSVNLRINKNVPKEFGFSDASVLPYLCVEGANASGKSKALQVITFIAQFCSFSFFDDPNSPIQFSTFFHNEKPADFYVVFCIEGIKDVEYTYKCKLKSKKVLSESLVEKKSREKTVLIKRTNNRIVTNNLFNNEDSFLLRDNASFISLLYQYQVKEIIPFRTFFASISSNTRSVLNSKNQYLEDYVANFYYEHRDVLKKVIHELKRFDTGVSDISFRKFEDSEGKVHYIPVFKHTTEGDVQELELQEQSTGTRVLFTKLFEIYLSLESGGSMVFDEMDSHLHSEIAKEIIKYFSDYDKNKRHAQLIFTSHNSSVLDISKKYRSYLMNKENGESFGYRIDEIKEKDLLRNDRPLEPVYKSGIIGGIPNVKEE